MKDRELKNLESLMNPRPGDYWHEMFCPYFIIVDVDKETESYTVLSCMGGPDSYNRKEEPCARVDNRDGTWQFDYAKSMKVNHAWIERAVTYGNIDGFVADVVQSEKTELIVQGWRDWRQKELRSKIRDLEAEWEQFTGWKYLKEEV
jgi:hypothetical protein